MSKQRKLEPMLEEEEVGDALRVTVSKLKTWRRQHIGPPHFRYGKLIRYRKADIEQFIADRMYATEDRPLFFPDHEKQLKQQAKSQHPGGGHG